MSGQGRNIEIPDFCLVVMIGAMGSGKSTFAREHFRPSEVVSSDWARGQVADDETAQDATEDAFDLVRHIVGLRLKRRRLSVVDATNIRPADRKDWVELARRYHALPVAIVIDPGEEIAVERNAGRPDRPSGPHVVRRMRGELKRGLRGLQREGFRLVHEIDGIAPVELSRAPLWTDRRGDHGPFDVIGDVHGCADELQALMTLLGYQARWHGDGESRRVEVVAPHGRKLVFVGDLVDRGPNTPDVIRIAQAVTQGGIGYCVMGNHDQKLARALGDRNPPGRPGGKGRRAIKIAHGLRESLDQIAAEPEGFRAEAQAYLRELRSHYWLDGGRLAVAHAGIKADMIGRGSGAVRAFTMYGETTGETDEFGLPERIDWARDYRGETAVVYGHVPVAQAQWVNETIDIDTGCVFGGALTALRWPERELVSVAAERTYVEPARPPKDHDAQVGAQTEADAVPDLSDVVGVRRITTALGGAVRIDAERSAAALEVASRFAVPPHWLCYLPPTMSPVATSPQDGWLERPEEAFSYFRERGVHELVVEEKHMGSRALLVVCRDEGAARRRFGTPEGEARTGRIWTRTGRAFFPDAEEAAVLERVRRGADAVGLWDELETDWVLFDAEIMPWSAKAQALIDQQYAPTGEAARIGLEAARTAFEQAGERVDGAAAFAAHLADRAARTELYDAAWRRYVWDAPTIDDLRVAPFHLLASEGAVHATRPHDWHMDWNARLAGTGDAMLHPTQWRTFNVGDDAACSDIVAWWEGETSAGSEGMVCKPRAFTARDAKGRLVQPALKVRGREYLRIIYGPDYDRPDNLARLKERGLGRKRSLALSEFALGLEALDRFVAGAPLRRWHECVLSVLALESEPVDPRL